MVIIYEVILYKAYARMSSGECQFILHQNQILEWNFLATRVKRYVALEDGVTRDNVGIQFVTLERDTMEKVKRYIFQSNDIEVLMEKQGQQIEEYGIDGPYRAVHMSVAWNTTQGGSSNLFNQHVDPVEVILMEFPYFVGANFGNNSYWRRAMAQQVGVVGKVFRHGRREIERFTDAELAWKQEVDRRIMDVLSYKTK